MNAILRMYYHGIVSGEIEIAEAVVPNSDAVSDDERKFAIYREEVRARIRRRD